MDAPSFVSYAQNGEDIVLWRVLRDIDQGCYVDVGANSPVVDSVTKAFYDRGWSGVDIEPVVAFANELRQSRPRDVVIAAAIAATEGEIVLHEFPGTGLSTTRTEYVRAGVDLGYSVQERIVPTQTLQSIVDEHLGDREVHFLKVDVEGAEAEVLRSVNLHAFRPWILIVEATRPNSTHTTFEEWEDLLLAAGYEFCLFDGLSRWYISSERSADLRSSLSYPACSLDGAIPASVLEVRAQLAGLQHRHHQTVQELAAHRERLVPLEAELAELRAELIRWRGHVLERWSAAVAGAAASSPADRAELQAMRGTLSWRITAPLRTLRSRQLRSLR